MKKPWGYSFSVTLDVKRERSDIMSQLMAASTTIQYGQKAGISTKKDKKSKKLLEQEATLSLVDPGLVENDPLVSTVLIFTFGVFFIYWINCPIFNCILIILCAYCFYYSSYFAMFVFLT